jgi:hypothetical protein
VFRFILAVTWLVAASQSLADPHTDYLLYCRGCHLHTGDPVPDANIPSLHELAPLLSTPGVSQSGMSDKQLAAVLNWVITEFNSTSIPEDFTRFTTEEVDRVRDKILINPLKAREEILKGS